MCDKTYISILALNTPVQLSHGLSLICVTVPDTASVIVCRRILQILHVNLQVPGRRDLGRVRHAGLTPALCAASRPSASMYERTTAVKFSARGPRLTSICTAKAQEGGRGGDAVCMR